MGKTTDLSVHFQQKVTDFHNSGISNGEIIKRLSLLRSPVPSVINKFNQFVSKETLHGRGSKSKFPPEELPVENVVWSKLSKEM